MFCGLACGGLLVWFVIWWFGVLVLGLVWWVCWVLPLWIGQVLWSFMLTLFVLCECRLVCVISIC